MNYSHSFIIYCICNSETNAITISYKCEFIEKYLVYLQ